MSSRPGLLSGARELEDIVEPAEAHGWIVAQCKPRLRDLIGALRLVAHEVEAFGEAVVVIAEQQDAVVRAVDTAGQTVVMVTHDANAAAVADRILLLADGRIVHDGAAGTADEVHDLMRTVA